MSRLILFPLLALGGTALLPAQTPAIPPAAEQIAGAVLPLPADLRGSSTVLGYGADGKLTMLRKGTGDMTCLASDPRQKEFHASCYHNDMEPFMARGRALRASGVTGGQVDTVRFKEVKEGKIKMPKTPAALSQLFGESYDPVKNEVTTRGSPGGPHAPGGCSGGHWSWSSPRSCSTHFGPCPIPSRRKLPIFRWSRSPDTSGHGK